jgi:hypothetical protein
MGHHAGGGIWSHVSFVDEDGGFESFHEVFGVFSAAVRTCLIGFFVVRVVEKSFSDPFPVLDLALEIFKIDRL